MKIYLAGPMRGYENFNFAAFDAAAANLRAVGHKVFSPADNDREKGYVVDDSHLAARPPEQVLRDCIMDDLTYIAREAEAVALLPGWEASKGCAAEVALAEFLALEIIYLDESTINGTPRQYVH